MKLRIPLVAHHRRRKWRSKMIQRIGPVGLGLMFASVHKGPKWKIMHEQFHKHDRWIERAAAGLNPFEGENDLCSLDRL